MDFDELFSVSDIPHALYREQLRYMTEDFTQEKREKQVLKAKYIVLKEQLASLKRDHAELRSKYTSICNECLCKCIDRDAKTDTQTNAPGGVRCTKTTNQRRKRREKCEK
jgi:hypothetical protein